MRLSLTVLLVTLALCCYEANATLCPAFRTELRSFFLDPEELYNLNLLRFFPPREASEAMIKVKQCVDRMPKQSRQKAHDVVEGIVSICNK
nr:secretoglobin family 1D member 2 [Desmodus rotundus]